jgi:probable rRNA maturation factor
MEQPTEIPIYFHFLNPITFSHRTCLKKFIWHLFLQEGIALETLNYIFCSDTYLYQMNVSYLKHDTYTDIITFPLSPYNAPIISDIYISTDRVKENALFYHTSQNKELHRVIFHGALHLCGYKDKTVAQKNRIREKENFYLNQYFVSRETL